MKKIFVIFLFLSNVLMASTESFAQNKKKSIPQDNSQVQKNLVLSVGFGFEVTESEAGRYEKRKFFPRFDII